MTLFEIDETGITHRAAKLSADGIYRYTLTRWWDPYLPWDLWLMCNPSTADGLVDDKTIARCTGFSRRFGSGGFVVVNAYAHRATKPAAMWAAHRSGVDIIGPHNNYWITRQLQHTSGHVIVAWGGHPGHDRVQEVGELVEASGRRALCLGTTIRGEPRHPLMLRNDTELAPYAWPHAA